MKLPAVISGRLPAGALAYALFVSVISSIILSAIILGVYYHQIEYLDGRNGNRSLVNLSSAVNLSLAMEDLPYHVQQRFQLFENGDDSVSITRQPWGLWDVLKVQSETGRWQHQKHYLRGYQRDEKGESSLFLVDEGRPMSVSGKAKISGVAYLPKAGVRSAYVGRIGYMNDQLLYGKRRESTEEMPVLNKKRLKTLEDFARGNVRSLYPGVLQAADEDTIAFPFEYDQVLFRKAWNWELSDSLSGRIWLHARNKIRVKARAKLENVILTAPIVEIDSGFSGSLQVVATDTILIGKNVRLEYPSFLGLINKKPPATIFMETGVEVNGVILMTGNERLFRQRILAIPDGATVNGQIYCQGMAEVQGTINGHLTARKFLINTFSGVYENYVFNTQLDAAALHPEFVGGDLWFYRNRKEVMQWLD